LQDCHRLLQIPDRRADAPDAQLGSQGLQPAQGQLHLHAALAAQQLMPFVGDEPVQVLEEVRVALGGQQHVQALGGGDEQLGQRLLLRRAFLGGSVAGACAHFPIQPQAVTHPLCALGDLTGQRAQRGDPDRLKAAGLRATSLRLSSDR
jgi:hypothetical protein